MFPSAMHDKRFGSEFLAQCPVMGSYEDTWGQPCPRLQWGPADHSYQTPLGLDPPQLQCYAQETFRTPEPQCFQTSMGVPLPFYGEDAGFFPLPSPGAYYEAPYEHNAGVIVPGLPCHRPQGEPWDYSRMCFDVNGDRSYQPCRYTGVVDLEDFMNNEKRKEKSRVAARCRRNKEQHIFSDLTAALPVRQDEVDQLDKASVMRLAISYLRVRDVVSMLPEMHKEESALTDEPSSLKPEDVSYLQALDGFVLVISQLGDVVYCSENVAEHLGISQLEMMGQSAFELSHPCDHDELREVLRARSSGGGPSAFMLRLKCTLSGKGRSLNIKSANYKVIHFTGHVVMPTEEKTVPKASSPEQNNNVDTASDNKMAAPQDIKMAAAQNIKMGDKVEEGTEKVPRIGALIAVGRPIPHPSNIETPFDNKTFLTKHSLDMKFTYFDEVLQKSLGYDEGELVGRSLYDLQHAGDSAALAQHFKSLFSKGQCETGRYRLLGKAGGFAWVQTQATLITDKQQRPVSVVCINHLISGIECKDEVFSASQMRHADLKPALPAAPAAKPKATRAAPRSVTAQIVPRFVRAPKETSCCPGNGDIVEEIGPRPLPTEEARPRPATAQIFAPRTKDMNKGFLMFSEDDPGLTMLKDEPEDLTHLAPTAGDACIPLEDSTFDIFRDFMLSDNYCSLLGDDLAESPGRSLDADSMLLSSPEPQESESSCEQSSLLTELSLDALDGRSEGELDGRAPYIPMSERDELPLLTPAVMWGALPDSVSLARPSPPEPAPPAAPALQRLLAAPPHTGPQPQDIITNIYADQALIPGGGVTTWDTGVKRHRAEGDEPKVKRSRRSASPAPAPAPSSSVLMNLLGPAGRPVRLHSKIVNSTQAFLPRNLQYNASKPPQPPPNSRPAIIPQLTGPMSPLSLNIGSPLYGSPISSSQNLSPRPQLSPYPTPPHSNPMSPLLNGRVFGKTMPSAYGRGATLSPGGVLQSGCDPFLCNKMLSPNIGDYRNDGGGDADKVSGGDDIGSWVEPDVLQETGNLLASLDDIRLI